MCSSFVRIYRSRAEHPWPRSALHTNSFAGIRQGRPASNGDLIIAECEAQARLRPNNYVWPAWREAAKRLRKAAQEAEQGDGIPTADVKEEVEDADPDAPIEDAPVDPVAQMDSESRSSA